jgi:hypothetical protein
MTQADACSITRVMTPRVTLLRVLRLLRMSQNRPVLVVEMSRILVTSAAAQAS